jgi:hypothetical protein
VSTGKISHVRGASALLQGSVNARGSETTYFFQYGPSTAYGGRSTPASAGSGVATIKVGQVVSGFFPGYHYRLVAFNKYGIAFGRDRVFSKLGRLKFRLAKSATTVFGSPVVVSGLLTGLGAANHRVTLEESQFPFREGFTSLGMSTLSNAAGAFSFRVGVLTQNTQFRVSTFDPLPLLSPVLTEHIAVRVTFKMRSSGRPGFVRFYGTVTPAAVGSRVLLQVQRPLRPGSKRFEKAEEREQVPARFVTQATTKVKRATRRFSRFSAILDIRRSGRYRAVVPISSGALSPGSSRSLYARAAPKRKGRAKR